MSSLEQQIMSDPLIVAMLFLALGQIAQFLKMRSLEQQIREMEKRNA